MSVETLAVVLHHSRAKGTAKLVLVGVANHDGDGGAWPTVATLARYANVSERNVQKAIESLIRSGELARHVQQGGHSGMRDWDRPNRYEVLLSCPAWCDRTKNHRAMRGWQADGQGGYTRQPETLIAMPTEAELREHQAQLDAAHDELHLADPPDASRTPRGTPPPAGWRDQLRAGASS